MASYSGATIYEDPADPLAVVVEYQPVIAGSADPVEPKRYLNVAGAAVPIQ